MILPGVTMVAPRRSLSENPCAGCSLEHVVKIAPILPPRRRLTVVGLGPWIEEERSETPFAGETGELLRSALALAGFDPESDVGYANLGRCRPSGGFESKDWEIAENRCWHHLQRDLYESRDPLLLLGSRPLQRFLADKRSSVKRRRGLWAGLANGRAAFSAHHPANVLRERSQEKREILRAQFQRDIRLMADRVLGREKIPSVQWRAFQLGDSDSRIALRKLAETQRPWFFDIETMDARECPSREGVATDPYHPDFQVRGVAVALDGERGAWFEFDQSMDRAEARRLLDPAFGSSAEKGAFVSGFDSCGLIARRWVSEIRNLTRDPWLAAIALDTRGGGHSLERLVVDVLGEPQPLGKSDRARIAELSLSDVARYAVGDACCEYRLDGVMRGRLERGEYL